VKHRQNFTSKTGVDDFPNKKTLGFSIGGFELGPYILPRSGTAFLSGKCS
jgi:hypothetical protein